MRKENMVELQLDGKWPVVSLSDAVPGNADEDAPTYGWNDKVRARLELTPNATAPGLVIRTVVSLPNQSGDLGFLIFESEMEPPVINQIRIPRNVVVPAGAYLAHPSAEWRMLTTRMLAQAIAAEAILALERRPTGEFEVWLICNDFNFSGQFRLDQSRLQPFILVGKAAEALLPAPALDVTFQPARYAKPQLIGWSFWSVLRRLFVR